MVDVNRLRVFRSIVASGSVNAAAQHLGYTPSAVSQQLTALQRETGLTLVERSGRGITPTPEGLELASLSDEVMGSLARLDVAIADLRSGRSETLTVSSFASAAEELMPRIAAQVLQEFPDVLFTFRLNEHSGQRHKAPDIDIVSEMVDAEPTSQPAYQRTVLMTDPYEVVLPLTHPLARQPVIRMAELADEPWIHEDPGDTTCGRIVDLAARSAGVQPRWVAHAGDHHAGIAFIAAEIGLAIMPRLAAMSLPPNVVRRPLVDPTPARRIVALVHRQALLKPAARRVLELLVESSELLALDD